DARAPAASQPSGCGKHNSPERCVPSGEGRGAAGARRRLSRAGGRRGLPAGRSRVGRPAWGCPRGRPKSGMRASRRSGCELWPRKGPRRGKFIWTIMQPLPWSQKLSRP
ncbi:SCLY isoform 14, partial [Pongo abelii]